MINFEICGKNYDKMCFAEKLGWFIVYPLLAILVLIIVAVILVIVAIIVIPILILVWIIMLVKLFEKRK